MRELAKISLSSLWIFIPKPTMKTKEFNAILKSVTSDNLFDLEKMVSLDDTIRSDMVHYIVRKRWPIVKELIPENFDLRWLHSMGYLYETKGKSFTFIHTLEHRIR